MVTKLVFILESKLVYNINYQDFINLLLLDSILVSN